MLVFVSGYIFALIFTKMNVFAIALLLTKACTSHSPHLRHHQKETSSPNLDSISRLVSRSIYFTNHMTRIGGDLSYYFSPLTKSIVNHQSQCDLPIGLFPINAAFSGFGSHLAIFSVSFLHRHVHVYSSAVIFGLILPKTNEPIHIITCVLSD